MNKLPVIGRRSPQLDLMRLVFATMVLLAHAPELTDGDSHRELLHRLIGRDYSLGTLGVVGFFLLSGYLIMQSWQRDPEFLSFLRKRVLRIVPGYLVAAVLSMVVLGLAAPGIDHWFHRLSFSFVKSLLLLGPPVTPPVTPGQYFGGVNGSLWTIPYEFRAYLLVAIAGLLGVVRRPLGMLAAALFFITLRLSPALLAHVSWQSHRFATGDPLDIVRMGAMFTIGSCFFLFRDRILFRPWLAVLAVAVIVGGWLTGGVPQLELAITLGGGYLLFYLKQAHIAALDRMPRMPDISYGVYLYGWPVEKLLIFYRSPSPWFTFAASVVLCYALGWLSWHFVERPMLTLKRRGTAPLPPA